MKKEGWNGMEKEEGGRGLPRGYCYPHYEPLEQRPTMTASQSRTNILCERDRGGVGKMTKMKGKKMRERSSGDRKY